MSAMDVSSANDSLKGNWEFANTLGEGAYGEVRLAINNRTQETRAVKIISLNLCNDKTSIQKEVLIHKTLNQENVIKYYSSFQQLDKFYIILEYASGGELFDRIEPDFGMSVDLAHKYFTHLIQGVEYLHSKGIVHRDLKPENLLLNELDQIKIADFGLATLFQYKGNERFLTSPCGTAPYVAPEVLSKSEYKAQPTDVWSCGIVLVAMLAGELPWDKPIADCADFVSWVKNSCYQRSPWCKIENTALSLVKKVLAYEPSKRLTIKQIKQTSWYVRSHNKKALQYEPNYNNNHNHNNQTSAAQMMSSSQPGDQNWSAFGASTQPTYLYINNNEGNSGGSDGCGSADLPPVSDELPTELEVTDSQQVCHCSSTGAFAADRTPFANAGNQGNSGAGNHHHHVESFSQPISTDNMILNSQIQLTQNQNASQFTQASQASPFLKLVKRMTRMFVHWSAETCTSELTQLFQKFMYDCKCSVTNPRQRQLTVSTNDKRQTLLTFKVNIIEMNSSNEVLVDFRLSRGDGLEFKKIFMKVKAQLGSMVCKRYVFTNQTNHNNCVSQRT